MKKFDRVEVGYINTPLEFMPNITKHFNKGNLYIKRDDLTGLACGGNKTRKLDYIIKYALDNGYDTVLTYGGPQTNHGRLTIAAAAKFGLKAILVCDGKKPQRMEGNLLLDRMMNAKIVFIDDEGYTPEEYQLHKKECVDKLLVDKVLEIPMGGSSTLGSYGYVMCAKEIVEQLKKDNIKIDYLVCAYGSTGTYAGLNLGASIYNADFKVVGIPVFPTPFSLDSCLDIMNNLAQELEVDNRFTLADLHIKGGLTNNKYAGPAYAKSNKEIRDAMYLMARSEAIITDPCYTAKAVYGMFDLIENDYLKKDANVLFLHTGGSPALFVNNHLDDMQDELWYEMIEEY